jgi:hypothetical protein
MDQSEVEQILELLKANHKMMARIEAEMKATRHEIVTAKKK